MTNGTVASRQVKINNIDYYNESTAITYTSNVSAGQLSIPAVVASISPDAVLSYTIDVSFKTSAKYTVSCPIAFAGNGPLGSGTWPGNISETLQRTNMTGIVTKDGAIFGTPTVYFNVPNWGFWSRTRFRPKQFVFVEPFLSGNYAKFSSNNGTFDPDRVTPIALSHYSWVFSGRACLLCNLQGVRDSSSYAFTNPAIHSKDKIFGATNFGVIGMASFFRRHQCNSLCQALEIDKIVPILGSALQNHGMPDTMNTSFWKENHMKDYDYAKVVKEYEKVLGKIDFSLSLSPRTKTK
jgi:hypothetical protein